MNLSEVKLKTNCEIISVDISEEKTKTRLMELGLIKGCVVKVEKRSVLKKTLLIVFNSTCFTLKDSLAKLIKVNYA